MKIDDSKLSKNRERSPQRVNSPADTIPFGIEGIQTVIKNNLKRTENGFSIEQVLRSELLRCKNENIHLRNALKEASKVNQQWRTYDGHQQNYLQKLLSTIHDLHQTTKVKMSRTSDQQHLQQEYIKLLQMQIQTHRDDWEVEKKERKAAESTRFQAETQVTFLQDQLDQAAIRLSVLEKRLMMCHCSSNGVGLRESRSHDRESNMSTSTSDSTESERCQFKSRLSGNSESSTPNGDKECISPCESLEMVSHSAVHEATFSEANVKENKSCEKKHSVTSGNEKSKIKDTFESKGAKPKVLNSLKNVNEEEKRAKHRARSILTSALPMSPTASVPPSPTNLLSSTVIPKNSAKETSSLTNPIYNYSHSSLNEVQNTPSSNIPEFNSIKVNNLVSQSSAPKGKHSKDCTSDSRTMLKLNKKVLTITNKQAEKPVLNYASISVMPGSSSALSSTTQEGSMSSSQSSSPGISLTTFALNAEGQGVPGTMFFAMRSNNKAQKDDIAVSVTEQKSKSDGSNSCSSRLVNSTWVKLMDKESNSGSPWRTARAVPSHQLSSAIRSNQEDKAINYAQISSVSPTFQVCDSQVKIPYQSVPQGVTTTSPIFYTTSSHICNGPDVDESDHEFEAKNMAVDPKSDMILKASKNISSAISNYKCASTILPITKERNPTRQIFPKISSDPVPHSIETLNSCVESAPQKLKCYLICPDCQMLFSEDQRSQFIQHVPVCAGPEYIDM